MRAYFLRRYIEWNRSQIDFAIIIDARYDEENSRTASVSFTKTTQTEYYRSLVFLNDL